MKFLIIDDSPADRELVMRKLRQEFKDVEFVEITRRSEFEHALSRADFDLALSDYRLHWSDGLQILRAVKSRDPYVPVVMATDSGSEEVAVEAMKSGLDDYVLKRHLGRLPISIKESLERSRLRRQVQETSEMLHQSEERYRMVSELSSDYAYSYRVEPDGSWTREWITDAFYRITGYSPGEIDVNGGWLSIVHPDDRALIEERHQRSHDRGPHTTEFRIVTKDGDVRWLKESACLVWDDTEDRVIRVYGAAEDITERKEAQEVLKAARDELEIRMAARTSELARINERLSEEIQVRAQVEHSLSESERWFHAMADFSYDWEYWTDSQGSFVYISPSCERISGYRPEELLASPGLFLDMVHPDDRPDVARQFRAEQDQPGEVGFDYRILTRGRQTRWVSYRSRPVYDAAGDQLGRRSTLRDITDHKRIEQERQRLIMILEETPDMVCSAAMDGRILHLNRTARQILGVTDDADLGRITIPDVHPQWANVIIAEQGIPTAIRDGLWRGELAVLSHDGREIPVSQVIMAHRGPHGEVEYLSMIARDITDAKAAQQAQGELQAKLQEYANELQAANEELEQVNEELRTANEELAVANEELEVQNEALQTARHDTERERRRYRDLFDFAPDAYLVTDPSGTIREANVPAARLFDMHAETLVGKSLASFIPPGAAQAFHARLRRLESGQNVEPWEMFIHPEDGPTPPVDVYASPMHDADGQVAGIRWLLHDISDRKAAEVERQSLAEENRRQRDFLSRLIEAAPIGIAVVRGAEHRYELVNPAYEAIPGIPDIDMLGRTMAEVFPAAAARGAFERLGEVYAGGRMVSLREYEADVGPGRQETYWDVDWVPLTAPDGGVEGVLNITREVTDKVLARRRIEALARDLEGQRARLRAILESAPEGIVVADAAGRVEYTNEVAEQIYARPVPYGEDHESHAEMALCHPDGTPYDPRHLPLTRSALDGETVREVEMMIRWPDGQYRDLLINSAPILDESGDSLGAVAIFQDITRDKELERERERLLDRIQQEQMHTAELAMELERERDLLSTVMEHTRTHLAYLDPEFRFVHVNTAYAEGSGHSAEELIGRNHFELFPNPENQAIFERVRDTGEPVYFIAKPFEYVDQPERGVTYWDWTLVPVTSGESGLQGFVFSLQDVTEQRRAALQREEHMERLAALIETSQGVLAETTLEGLMQGVAEAARRLTGARIGTVGHGYHDGHFDIGAISHTEGSPACPPGETFTMERGGVYMDMVEKGPSLRLCDHELRSHPAWWGLPEGHAPLRGLLGARMTGVDGLTNGLIMVSDKEGGEFTPEDEAALTQLAVLASLGLRHIEARDAAAQRADELDAVFGAVAEALVVYDASGTVVRANPAASRLMGRDVVGADRAELLQSLSMRRLDGGPMDMKHMTASRALRGETMLAERELFTDATGRDIIVQASAAPIRQTGKVAGAVVTWVDITQRERSQELSETLNDINALLASTLDVDTVMDQVLARAAGALGSDAGIIHSYEQERWIKHHVWGSLTDLRGCMACDQATCLPAAAVKTGTVLAIPDVSADDCVWLDATLRREKKSVLVAPFVMKGQATGAVGFVYRSPRREFGETEIDFARKLAASISLALENARLYAAESQQRLLYETVVSHAPVGIAILDSQDLRVKWANPTCRTYLSQTCGMTQIVGSSFDELVPAFDGHDTRARVEEAIAGGKALTRPELEYRAPSRGVTYWHSSLLPIPTGGSTRPDVMVMLLDISDQVHARKRVEELAAEAERQRGWLEAVLETLPVGVFIANASGRIVRKNAMVNQIWGGETPLPESIEEYEAFRGWWPETGKPLRPEDWGLARAVTRGETSIGEMIDIQRLDGNRGTLLNSACPIRDRDGNITGGLAVIQDITERRQLEQQIYERTLELEERNKELDAFAHNVAHDLKNPLMFIRHAETLEEEFTSLSEQELREALHLISANAAWMSSIIQELLLLAELRAKDVERQPLDLGGLVGNVQKSLAFVREEYDAHISVPETWPIALGHAPWVEQVWVNYLTNAMKYGGPKAQIEMGAELQPDGMVRCWVRDHGPGLTPEECAGLFVPFKRIPRMRAKGHGLGLSIVHSIVTKLGGQVGVESQPGQGATFWFTLPGPRSGK